MSESKNSHKEKATPDSNNEIVYTDNNGITYTKEDVEAAGGIAELVRLSAGSYDR